MQLFGFACEVSREIQVSQNQEALSLERQPKIERQLVLYD